METSELLAPFERLLSEIASPAAIRAIEAGGSVTQIWDVLRQSGYLDALVSEQNGGSGLAFRDVSALLMALGKHAVPVPVAETMIARALLVDAGVEVPNGAIALATAFDRSANATPFAMVAEHLLIDLEHQLVLARIADLHRDHIGTSRTLAAHLSWSGSPSGPSLPVPVGGLRVLGAIVRATAIAGAAEHLLEMTVDYANARIQFGKPIGKQQALQQQLAQMAELVIACRLAAQTGCNATQFPDVHKVALAKQVTSAAAPQIANIAHAIHGAIGISEAHDLQLYTRRLHEWRLADGAESWWARRIGEDCLAFQGGSLDFVRSHLA